MGCGGWVIRRSPWWLGVLALTIASACLRPDESARETVIRNGVFTFPSLASVMAPVIQQQGLDRARGFRLQTVSYGAVSAYYAGLATGEVDTLPGGPLVFQKMRAQGVPIKIAATYATLASLAVISVHPSARSLRDLKGTKLAADMSSSEYQALRLIARDEGVALGEDIPVIQSTPPVARAHLLSGEVISILTFEPSATMVLDDTPGARITVSGKAGWQRLGYGSGWLLVSLVREDWAARHPEVVTQWLGALRDAARFIAQEPEAADRIVSAAIGLPPGVLQRGIEAGRIEFDVQPAAQQADSLRQMFQAAVDLGFAVETPRDPFIH